jgi:prepilin-type N-terminal cleavage/methylation domain-containing protein
MKSMLNWKHEQQGFSLLEVLVAMSVLSLVGLMAWRGMDAMIRGKEVIDQRTEEDSKYLYLAKQFDKDCSEIPNASQIGFSPIELREGELWLLRKFSANGNLNWMLVVYKAGGAGFKRQVIVSSADLLEIKRYFSSSNINQNTTQENIDSILHIHEISHQVLELIPQSNDVSAQSARGIKVRWYVNNLSNPLTRSCLIGQGL